MRVELKGMKSMVIYPKLSLLIIELIMLYFFAILFETRFRSNSTRTHVFQDSDFPGCITGRQVW